MEQFKSIILPIQGHSKSQLSWLYNTKYTTNPDMEEREKVFSYCSLRFWFAGASFRNTEKLFLFVEIPVSFVEAAYGNDEVPIESYLLHILSPLVNNLSHEYINQAKNVREKAQFDTQTADEVMLRRSGIHFNSERSCVVLTIHFNVPLVNALSVNAKAAIRAVKDILEHIEAAMKALDTDELASYISCYRKQEQIRKYLKRYDLCAFVADGSILPRENGTQKPMHDAIPFCTPKSLVVTIPFDDGTSITGMGIGRGVTVITGGGYSGKSTLLDAIESGVYNHIPGDGREYVITDHTALKIYAEDGRPVHSLDLSPFFHHLPQDKCVNCFSTLHASGSVSQAANIIEAVCGGTNLLLIDEDKSATNFMIRDRNMRKIVKNEPIIPFTDRVRELYRDKAVSTILVIGGSSEYLSCADCVILMDDYVAKDITTEVVELELSQNIPETHKANWTEIRRLVPRQTTQAFLYFRSVETENEKKIILDEYSADITLLTSVLSSDQMNTLACVMEQLLTDKEVDDAELIEKSTIIAAQIFNGSEFESRSLLADTKLRWYADIRPLDIFCCANRMRGLSFYSKADVIKQNKLGGL